MSKSHYKDHKAPSKTVSARKLALGVLHGVVSQGQSTGQTLPAAQLQCSERDRGLLQQLVMGCLQQWFGLQAELAQYLQKPLKQKDADILCVLAIGLYQIRHTRIPAHAAISETVNLCPKNKSWARGLCNAVLRRASTAAVEPTQTVELPKWLEAKVAVDWPNDFDGIAQHSGQSAPLTLRAVVDRESLSQQLNDNGIEHRPHPIANSALSLEQGQDITQLPGFSDGEFVVQDAAAQLAGTLLAPKNGERILDACAAPGGKTTHLLQLAPSAQLTALDSEASRLERVQENLSRLRQSANLVTADARAVDEWWDHTPFDRILLDAPCTATGVIRRHPDIKLLRREDDVAALVSLQAEILDALWKTLALGGSLLYCTCSILRDENDRQIAQFLARTSDAQEIALETPWGHDGQHGKQIFPGDYEMDGFYYCLLQKSL